MRGQQCSWMQITSQCGAHECTLCGDGLCHFTLSASFALVEHLHIVGRHASSFLAQLLHATSHLASESLLQQLCVLLQHRQHNTPRKNCEPLTLTHHAGSALLPL